MRQQHPNASSSMLVRMKALMALVTFWILLSLLGPLVCLMGAQTQTWVCWTTPIITHHPTFPFIPVISGYI